MEQTDTPDLQLAAARIKARLGEIREQDPGNILSGIWRCLAELGWFGYLIPDEFGGSAHGVVFMALVYEELTKHGVLLKLSPISNSLILNDVAERVLNLPRSR